MILMKLQKLTILQNLIIKQKIKTATDIVSHLRKYVSVEDMIGLMMSINSILKQTNYIRTGNHFYTKYLELYLELIS